MVHQPPVEEVLAPPAEEEHAPPEGEAPTSCRGGHIISPGSDLVPLGWLGGGTEHFNNTAKGIAWGAGSLN